MTDTALSSRKTRSDLGQYFTPDWVALELVERYFGDLTLCDRVVEPSCGPGAFLRAIPDHVPALGVEICEGLAREARESSRREVIVGDFREVELSIAPTAVIGNPPFKQALIQAFLDRAWNLLPNEGRVGFILPCFALQTASVVDRLACRWSIRQDMIPRNIFPRLTSPLCFALLTKSRQRTLVGFALYAETSSVQRMRKRYRAMLAQGHRSVWSAVVEAAFAELGGIGTLDELYREIEPHRPTPNAFWREKVRQTVQRIATRVGPGQWSMLLREQPAAAACLS